MSGIYEAIQALSQAHTELVDTVKSFPGTVAGATNDALHLGTVSNRSVAQRATTLRNHIEADGQTLILDWRYDVAVIRGEGKPLDSQWTGGEWIRTGLSLEAAQAHIPLGDWFRLSEGTFAIKGTFNKAQVFGEEITGMGTLVMTYLNTTINLYFSSADITGGTLPTEAVAVESVDGTLIESVEFYPRHMNTHTAATLAFSPALRLSDQSFVMVG